MKPAHAILEKLYWLLVAAVPFFPWYRLDSLQEKLGCTFGSPCFEHGLPFQVEGAFAGLLTGLLLWPMCIWHLGGKHLWGRFVRVPRNVP